MERTLAGGVTVASDWQARLCINCGVSGSSDELSDWGVGVVVVYSRELNDTEIAAMEAHLAGAYGVGLHAPRE